jgi:NADP-dependent 3-hydroxy acid dehydrogenase YdfG
MVVMKSTSIEAQRQKVAVIVWAASVVGELISTLLVHKGWVVYGLDSHWEQEGIYKRVARMRVDLNDLDATQRAIGELANMYTIDALINISQVDSAVQDPQYIVNRQFVYPSQIAGYMANIMKANDNGTIVNVSSVPLVQHDATIPYYNACKSAIVAYSKAVKPHLMQHNVKICTVHSGPVRYRVRNKSSIDKGAKDTNMEIAKTILRATTSKSVVDMYTVGY